MLRGGWPDGVAARNKVTNSLMAITVIMVGVVNCFSLGLMMYGAGATQLGRSKEAVGVEGVSGRGRMGEGSRRWAAGLNCQSRL